MILIFDDFDAFNQLGERVGPVCIIINVLYTTDTNTKKYICHRNGSGAGGKIVSKVLGIFISPFILKRFGFESTFNTAAR